MNLLQKIFGRKGKDSDHPILEGKLDCMKVDGGVVAAPPEITNIFRKLEVEKELREDHVHLQYPVCGATLILDNKIALFYHCPSCPEGQNQYGLLSSASKVTPLPSKSQTSQASSIHDAAQGEDLEKIRTLLSGNPDLVFSKATFGMTALHMAALFGCKGAAELLIANRAEVNANDENGDTPLHLAAREGHKDLAELLLAGKATINAKNKDGETPLHEAAARHAESVRISGSNNTESVTTKKGIR